jgi:hypothetical protein
MSAIKRTQIDAANALRMTLDKLANPVLSHRPLYDLFSKVSDDLTGSRDMSISQAIDIT